MSRPRRAPSQWKPVVVEINSARGVWSRALFYHLTALSVLPAQIGGLGQTTVWLNSDACFSATRLQAEIEEMLPKQVDPMDGDRAALYSLKHVHVFRTQSSEQVIETLKALPQYLFNTFKHHSADRRLGLIVLDSATSFYWQDRVAAEEAYYMHTDKHESQPSRASSIIAQLQKLQQEFRCAIVFSTSYQSRPSQPRGHSRADGTAMPEEPRGVSSWTAFATLNLRVFRSKSARAVGRLAEGLSNMDQPTSKPVLFVEPESDLSHRWSASAKRAVQELDGHGRFQFRPSNDK